MTAKRNLIQFYTYASSNEVLNRETVRRKLEHCQDFYNVLTKVDTNSDHVDGAIMCDCVGRSWLLGNSKLRPERAQLLSVVHLPAGLPAGEDEPGGVLVEVAAESRRPRRGPEKQENGAVWKLATFLCRLIFAFNRHSNKKAELNSKTLIRKFCISRPYRQLP